MTIVGGAAHDLGLVKFTDLVKFAHGERAKPSSGQNCSSAVILTLNLTILSLRRRHMDRDRSQH